MAIDFNDAPDKGTDFKPLKEGWYKITCVKAEMTKSSTNKDMIKAEFNVAEPASLSKRKVWNNFVLTPAAYWVIKNALDAMGKGGIAEGVVEEKDLVAGLIGGTVGAYLVPGQGSNNNVEKWAKPDSITVVSLDEQATTTAPAAGGSKFM